MHSKESRSSGHSDTSLEALPAKSVLLSTAKRLLIRLYDENGDKMFALPIRNKECLTLSRSTQIKSRTAMLFEKLQGAIKKKHSASLRQPKHVVRLAGAKLKTFIFLTQLEKRHQI